jgi:cullin-4
MRCNFSVLPHTLNVFSFITHTDGNGSNADMDIQVLTTGYWPQYAQCSTIKLPSAIKEHISHFESYYDSKYQGRRISWQYSLCNCTLKANFPRKKLDLNVSLFQALVLLCFNESDSLTLPQVMTLTGIQDRPELERLLQSLSLGKHGTRVLLKIDPTPTPTGSDSGKPGRKAVLDTDLFQYSTEFTNKLNRIKISSIQAKEAVHKEQAKVHEQAARDRQYLIDAAVVRIMKARKTLAHRDLIGEVMNQIKHVSRPTSTEIKKRLEGLMEREYLARDEADSSVYNYLA